MTAATFASLSGLAFDDHELALIPPALRFELAIASAQGPEVFDFYRKSRAALGDRLQFVDTGAGAWKKNHRQNLTAASLNIDFVARPPHEPTPALPTEMLLD